MHREQGLSDSPSISGTAGAPASVRAAIARAAQATGVDFSYLLAQAKLESSLDPQAHAGNSSAAGLYQFTRSTWAQTLSRHGADHGMDWATSAASDLDTRAQVMALRYDPDASAMMAAELAADNRADLTAVLGREPEPAELYLGHFLGIGGARTFLSALAADPTRSAASVLPAAAAANRAIFHGAHGPRSLGEVMDLIRGRFATALADDGADIRPDTDADTGTRLSPEFVTPLGGFAGGPLAQEFHAAQAQAAPGSPPVATRSMAETLDVSFGPAAPASVRAAYARLASFGL